MFKVCIDPGHGGRDPGAVLGKRYEKEDALRLALAVKPLLTAHGVAVILTRADDRAVTIGQRCAMANEEGCNYFLSLHRDAAGPAAYGLGLWIHSRADAPTTQKAQLLLEPLLAVAPTKDRGVQKGTPQSYADFGVNTQTRMASALLELGFVTNAQDNARFDRYLEQYAAAIADGVREIAKMSNGI